MRRQGIDGASIEHERFRFAYDPPTIRFGRRCVEELGAEVGAAGGSNALVVTGRTVGAAPAVMEPVREGLGGRLAGVAAASTPDKRLSEALACAERFRDADADAIVALGSGSSLDVARVTAAVVASDRAPAELAACLVETGSLPVPDGSPPVVAVPTTLAGAGLSMLSGVTAVPDGGLVDAPVAGGMGGPALMPAATLYDPALLETTPRDVLAGSAMNGLNKAVETCYSGAGTAMTDATASRGVRLMTHGFPDEPDGEWNLDAALRGVSLAGYGTSRADGTTFSVIHALGHALRVETGVQLGVAHAVVAPAAIESVFTASNANPSLLAGAFGVDVPADADDETLVAGIRERMASIRNGLGHPAGFASVPAVDRDALDDVAALAAEGFLSANAAPGSSDGSGRRGDPVTTAHPWAGTPRAPPGLTVTADSLRATLDDAW